MKTKKYQMGGTVPTGGAMTTMPARARKAQEQEKEERRMMPGRKQGHMNENKMMNKIATGLGGSSLKLEGRGITYKSGGSIDGCAVKGKTKGKEVKMSKMKMGGKVKGKC